MKMSALKTMTENVVSCFCDYCFADSSVERRTVWTIANVARRNAMTALCAWSCPHLWLFCDGRYRHMQRLR